MLAEQLKLTLTTLSQPHDTITGFMTLGLKRTHDTLPDSISERARRHTETHGAHHSE